MGLFYSKSQDIDISKLYEEQECTFLFEPRSWHSKYAPEYKDRILDVIDDYVNNGNLTQIVNLYVGKYDLPTFYYCNRKNVDKFMCELYKCIRKEQISIDIPKMRSRDKWIIQFAEGSIETINQQSLALLFKHKVFDTYTIPYFLDMYRKSVTKYKILFRHIDVCVSIYIRMSTMNDFDEEELYDFIRFLYNHFPWQFLNIIRAYPFIFPRMIDLGFSKFRDHMHVAKWNIDMEYEDPIFTFCVYNPKYCKDLNKYGDALKEHEKIILQAISDKTTLSIFGLTNN